MKDHSRKRLFARTGTVFISLFLAVHLFAGEITLDNGKNAVTFTSSSYQELNFTSHLSAIHFRDIETSRGTFTELFVDGYGWRNIEGDPKLPVYHKLIEVPLNATFSIIIKRIRYVEYDLANAGITYKLIPAQPPLSKNIIDPTQIPFIFNEKTYQKNLFIGDEVVSVSPVGILRSVRLANLTIAPFHYNPVTNKLMIINDLEVTVSFQNADIASTIQLKRNTFSPWFENIYRLIPNYQPPEADSLITEPNLTYVIVSDPAFQSALQPFIKWKTRKGYMVIQAYTNNPNVGNTTASIKNYLQGLYYNPPAGYSSPSFILFVGDVAQIPAWATNGHPSDLLYCEYTNDNIPEVFYGRFSAQTLTQLQAYIDKTLEYEQYQIPVEAYLDTVSMIAGADATNGPLYGNGQINYGTSTYFNPAHNLISHTYLQPEPPGGNYSQHIRQDVSNGVAFSNYTAHGSELGWADPQFEISQIPALQNEHKYCLMVGNCCKTSNFSVTCFAEEITRTPGKGALGYIGCSDYSYWDEDYWWACGFKAVTTNPVYNAQHLGAYDGTFHDHGESTSKWFVTQGQMVVGGCLAVQESNSSLKQYYWETYCLMGDPSVSIYYSVPDLITATYPTSVQVGTSTITVNTEQYAYVALSLGDTTVLDARCADSTGVVNLSFNPVNQVCTLYLVITEQNHKPLIDSISVNVFVVNATAAPNILCKGDSSQLSVTVNGGSGNYTYLWSPSTYLNDPTIPNPLTIPDSSIIYTVAVDDGTYIVTSSPVNISVKVTPPIPVVTLHTDTLVSDAPSNNQWYKDHQPIPGATGQTYIITTSGEYYVVVSNPLTGCSSASNVIQYFFNALDNISLEKYISIYPNPARDEMTVNLIIPQAGPVTIILKDALGNDVKSIVSGIHLDEGAHMVIFDRGLLPDGLYYLTIRTNGYTVTKKVILSK